MSASTERKNRAAAKAAGTDKKTNAALEAEQKARKSKRKWIISTVAVVLCIALVLFLSSPLMYRITTAVSVGDKNYSPAEYNYIQSSVKSNVSYDALASYFGQDIADQQLEAGMERTLIQNTALLRYAKENNIRLSDQEKSEIADGVKSQMSAVRSYAKANGVSMSRYMSYVFGPGVNEQIIRSCTEDSTLVQKAYFSKYCSFSFSPEELAAAYADLTDAEVFSYALFLVKTDENRPAEEAKTAAEAVVMSFTDGYDGETEPDVALSDLLAEEFPDEAPTVRTGVTSAQLDEAARSWLTEEGRAKGDITSIEAPDGTGWYVVLFLDRTANDTPTATVRHILVKAEANEEGVVTDEAKAAASARAEEILAGWQAGEKTEADFATLAYLLSDDTASRSTGGLYTVAADSGYTKEFEDFALAEHQYGDAEIVFVESGGYTGYHIMFYVDRLSARDVSARGSLRDAAMSEWSASLYNDLEIVTHWASKW
jgi:parvulin-like peptidyl-prolyl isomerase